MTIELVPISRIADDPNITTKGSFVAGTTAIFLFSFPDIDGSLFDPSDIDISIIDPDGTTVVTAPNADRIDIGQYAFEWKIPATSTPGLYDLIIDFVVEQQDGAAQETFTESFVVLEEEATNIFDIELLAFRFLVGTFLGYTQRVPVFHETGRLNKTRNKAIFSFPRWNQPSGVRMFLNGQLKDRGYEVDYLKGEILFDSALSEVDELHVNYNFRWFTDNELDSFIAQALQVFNSYTPHSTYYVTNLPLRYGVTVAEQAAVIALRRIIMDLHFQEPAKVFGGMDRADKLITSFDMLKKNYEEEIKGLLEQKAFGPYIGLTKTLTTPEFTLPGGRSRWFRYLFKGA